MNIFVISLKSSTERREKVQHLLNSIGVKFNFFDAENIKDNHNHNIFNLYNKRKTLLLKGYELTTPELGCFASHIALWQKCVNINEPILILEDNIELLGDISYQLNNIKNLTEIYGVIKLSNIFERKHLKTMNIDTDYILVSHLSGACGTSAYAISPKSASKYLSLVSGFFEPVDDFMDNEWRTRQTLYSYSPELIVRGSVSSTIGKRKIKIKTTIPSKLIPELYRTYRQFRQKIYNIRFK